MGKSQKVFIELWFLALYLQIFLTEINVHHLFSWDDKFLSKNLTEQYCYAEFQIKFFAKIVNKIDFLKKIINLRVIWNSKAEAIFWNYISKSNF